jgi:hypothetical protein
MQAWGDVILPDVIPAVKHLLKGLDSNIIETTCAYGREYRQLSI